MQDRFRRPYLVFLMFAAALYTPVFLPGGPGNGWVDFAHAQERERILLVNAAIQNGVSPVDRIRILTALEQHLAEGRLLSVVQPAQNQKTTPLINQIYRVGSIEEGLPSVRKLGQAMGEKNVLVVSIAPALKDQLISGFLLQSSFMNAETGKVTVNEPIALNRDLSDLNTKLKEVKLPIGRTSQGESSDILSILGEGIEEEGLIQEPKSSSKEPSVKPTASPTDQKSSEIAKKDNASSKKDHASSIPAISQTPEGLKKDQPITTASASPWYKQWWVWTAAGVVLAGSAGAIVGVSLVGDDDNTEVQDTGGVSLEINF